VDGAAFRVGSWTEASTGTGHDLVPSSMGCTSTQMAKSPSYPRQSLALPQDLFLPQEAGSPLAKGALSQGPSTPAASVPSVAQAPCSAIQVYSRRWKEKLESIMAETESSPVQDFIPELTKPVGGLVPRPIPKRRAKQLSANFVPRCSTRHAKNRAGASSAVTRCTQQNLMLKLGLVAEPETLG
jgi:hypothetical protein